MKRHHIILYIVFFFTLCVFDIVKAEPNTIKCGIAKGYPPYQFQDVKGEPIGIDVDVMKAISSVINVNIVFHQKEWDDIVTSLRLGKLDCIAGIEKNAIRSKMFDFTSLYYTRKNVVFVKKNDMSITSLNDLKWKQIAGDRHSYVENLLEDLRLKNKIRIRQTKSKEMSFQMLKKGKVVAVIAPEAVGLYLAKKNQIAVKIIEASDPGSPVSIAVEKNRTSLLESIESALITIQHDGTLASILSKWK